MAHGSELNIAPIIGVHGDVQEDIRFVLARPVGSLALVLRGQPVQRDDRHSLLDLQGDIVQQPSQIAGCEVNGHGINVDIDEILAGHVDLQSINSGSPEPEVYVIKPAVDIGDIGPDIEGQVDQRAEQ